MKRLPVMGLTATPCGLLSSALVGEPPSPSNPVRPLPTTVVMIPVELTMRMRLLLESAMIRLPEPSKAMEVGFCSCADPQSPPSPP